MASESWLLCLQVSQVYESITLSRLVELAPLTNTTELEKVVVETASSNNIQVGSRQDGRRRGCTTSTCVARPMIIPNKRVQCMSCCYFCPKFLTRNMVLVLGSS